MTIVPASRRAAAHVSRRPERPSWAGMAVAFLLLWSGASGTATQPTATQQKKLDWAGLDSLLAAGDYERAVTAAGDIATQLEPNRRDPDFVARSIGFARALMRRGLAELKLGRLDAASKTFEEAYRTLKDSNFKRLVSIEARTANAQVMSTLILLDLNFIELLELRMAVLMERFHFLNLGLDAPGSSTPADEAELQKLTAEWLEDLEALEKNGRESRKNLEEKFGQAGQAILGSPRYQALAGSFRPSLLAGVKVLELARLPVSATGSEQNVPQPGPKPRVGEAAIADATRFLKEASQALAEAIDAAAPKGASTMKPEARIEAALLRGELLVSEGRVRLAANDPVGARDCFAKAMDLRQEASVLLKLPKPAEHPDLFLPLLLCTEATLDRANSELRSGDPARARGSVAEAAKLLARAQLLPLSQEHPLQKLVAGLEARITAGDSAVVAKTPETDALDTAGRRLRRVLDRTPLPGLELRP